MGLAGGVTWSEVEHRAERIAIFGSGPSLRGVRIEVPLGVTTVGVGGTLGHVPLNFWFTADCSSLNRMRMASAPRFPGTVFYAAVDNAYGTPAAPRIFLRKPAEPGIRYLRRPKLQGLSEDPRAVHGGNSAFGALGLAFLMGAKRIALLGVDGHRQLGYAWGTGKPRNLTGMPGLFRSAVRQLERVGVEVVVGSPKSVLTWWPRMTPEDALGWLAGSIIEAGEVTCG